ncbi:MAG: DinB family protein, partial [Tepidiformaceae bacterium]
MSTLTHLAALEDIQDSLKWLGEVITGLPVDALDWVPSRGANSIAVLASHAVPSTVFWVLAGSGKNPSHAAYVRDHRTRSFQVRDMSDASLLSVIHRAAAEVEAVLRQGTEADLAAPYAHDDEPGEQPVTGVTGLVHGASHLRE